jgi:hypothetical protein
VSTKDSFFRFLVELDLKRTELRSDRIGREYRRTEQVSCANSLLNIRLVRCGSIEVEEMLVTEGWENVKVRLCLTNFCKAQTQPVNIHCLFFHIDTGHFWNIDYAKSKTLGSHWLEFNMR